MKREEIIYDRQARCDAIVVKILGCGESDTSFAGTVIEDGSGEYGIGHYSKGWSISVFELIPLPNPDQAFIDSAIIAAMQVTHSTLAQDRKYTAGYGTPESITSAVIDAVNIALAARQHFTSPDKIEG